MTTKIISMTIGNKIKKLRELKNFTQEYMAEALKMSQTGYGKIERDETDIILNKNWFAKKAGEI